MAVNFYLDSRTDKKGDAPIRMSVAIKGVRYLSSTGYKVPPEKWDGAKQQVKRGCSNAAGITYVTINSALAKIVDHFTAYENECITSNTTPTLDGLKKDFAERFGRRKAKEIATERGNTLFDYFDQFRAEMGQTNQWTEGTHEKFAALRNHFLGFKADLSFSDFDEKGFNSFIQYLLHNADMINSTVSKQLGYIKWFLRWATMRGYNSNLTFQTFSAKLKTAPKKVIFLSWDELMTLYHYEIPENGTKVELTDENGKPYIKQVYDAAAMAKTRDIFCFSCFTSLRYSDAANLKKADIAESSLTITTIKTGDTITIELNKYSQEILSKYAHLADAKGYAFPRITNQRMNLYLKELCELCEIKQPITQTFYKGNKRIDISSPKYALISTHAGRRTFICNSLMLGIPAEIVMKWTGHSDYKAMKPYIDVTNDAKANAMKLFDAL